METFPLRDPLPGEPRPSWWWSLFYYQVLVMQGKIKVEDKVEPDIVVTAGQEVLETFYGSDLAGFVHDSSIPYVVGRLNIEEPLFIPDSIVKANGYARQILRGELKEMPVILRADKFPLYHMVEFGEDYTTDVYRSEYHPIAKEGRILVFWWGQIIPFEGLVFKEGIPNENLDEVKRIIAYRKERS
jgi:hypothetical protein